MDLMSEMNLQLLPVPTTATPLTVSKFLERRTALEQVRLYWNRKALSLIRCLFSCNRPLRTFLISLSGWWVTAVTTLDDCAGTTYTVYNENQKPRVTKDRIRTRRQLWPHHCSVWAPSPCSLGGRVGKIDRQPGSTSGHFEMMSISDLVARLWIWSRSSSPGWRAKYVHTLERA
jgi:hypothetical protein